MALALGSPDDAVQRVRRLRLDVDRERLQRGDARGRLCQVKGRLGGQSVDGPQECGQGSYLSRSRATHKSVVAVGN